jgi:hypothetical protein
MAKHDVAKLEAKIKELAGALGGLSPATATAQGGGGDLLALIPIIHKPGWTTIAEFQLVEGVLDAMLTQSKQLAGLKTVLIGASHAIGTTPAER